jgi:hypothetical protein
MYVGSYLWKKAVRLALEMEAPAAAGGDGAGGSMFAGAGAGDSPPESMDPLGAPGIAPYFLSRAAFSSAAEYASRISSTRGMYVGPYLW